MDKVQMWGRQLKGSKEYFLLLTATYSEAFITMSIDWDLNSVREHWTGILHTYLIRKQFSMEYAMFKLNWYQEHTHTHIHRHIQANTCYAYSLLTNTLNWYPLILDPHLQTPSSYVTIAFLHTHNSHCKITGKITEVVSPVTESVRLKLVPFWTFWPTSTRNTLRKWTNCKVDIITI